MSDYRDDSNKSLDRPDPIEPTAIEPVAIEPVPIEATPIKPTPITPTKVPLSYSGGDNAAGNPPGQPSPPPRPQFTLVAALLIALVLIVLAVVFVLPRWIAHSEQAAPPEAAESDAPPSSSSPPATAVADTSPQEEARQNAARRDSQPLLTELLELQRELDQHGVAHWAEEPYQQAQALLATGDEYYRQRDFVTALAHYQQTHVQLKALQQQVEPRLQKALEDGMTALEAGNAEEAERHFSLALVIDTDNEKASHGLERIQVLDEVLVIIEDASTLEQHGELEPALEHFEKALTLDKDSAAARTGRDRVRQAITQQRYQAALDRGFTAIQAGDDRAAQQAFREALEIHPNDSTARSGLTQASNRIAQRQISADLQEARTLEQQERWREAEQIYARLHQVDDSLVDARVGRIRAAARIELDQQIEQILADPLRLGSEPVLTQAQQTLRDARAVNDPGPRLTRQVAALDQTLQLASIPVTVSVNSDKRTRVTVLRVAELGTLQHTELQLRPGRYVAIGSRDGYRDVRIEFEVPPGSSGIAVEIVCREPIRS